MLGCFSSLSREISLMAVLGTPSVSLQKRRAQQWRQGAKKGASALGRHLCVPPIPQRWELCPLHILNTT